MTKAVKLNDTTLVNPDQIAIVEVTKDATILYTSGAMKLTVPVKDIPHKALLDLLFPGGIDGLAG